MAGIRQRGNRPKLPKHLRGTGKKKDRDAKSLEAYQAKRLARRARVLKNRNRRGGKHPHRRGRNKK